MSKRPQISVIIPVYNVEPYLKECLQSIVAQTFSPLEVVLVNDGSADGSGDICKRFLAQYPNWIYIEQTNQGVASARKKGLAHAYGEYLAFVDSDDVLSPNYFSALWAAREPTGAELVLAPMYRFVADIKTSSAPEGTFWQESCLAGVERSRVCENFSASLALCGKLFSRSLWELIKPQCPDLPSGDDILPSVQLLAGAKTIALAPQAAYYYRQSRPNSQSSSGNKRFEGLFEGFLLAQQYLKQTGQYGQFAVGFERVRFICLTSFMEKFGLNETQRTLLQTHKNDLKIPFLACRNWPWKLRVRAVFLIVCLWAGIPYDKAAQHLRKFLFLR